MEAAEASAVHAEEFQKENLSVEKDASFSNVDRTCKYRHRHPHQHPHCTLDVAIRRCRCRCREKDQQNGASFCRLNRQDSSAVDSLTAVDRAEEKLKLSSPNAAFSSVAKKQQLEESVTGFLPQTPKDLPERITLPPKKRTCMNMEINSQPSTIFGKEAFFPSNLAIPATFNSDNTLSTVEFDPRNNLQREPHVEEASRKILVETSGSSAKYMKPSRLLLRRYKLLSEIV